MRTRIVSRIDGVLIVLGRSIGHFIVLLTITIVSESVSKNEARALQTLFAHGVRSTPLLLVLLQYIVKCSDATKQNDERRIIIVSVPAATRIGIILHLVDSCQSSLVT
jgi:hypothetical protein